MIDIYLVTTVNTKSEQQFNAAVQVNFKEFKEAFIDRLSPV